MWDMDMNELRFWDKGAGSIDKWKEDK